MKQPAITTTVNMMCMSRMMDMCMSCAAYFLLSAPVRMPV